MKPDPNYNFFRIDDLLIRSGTVLAITVAFVLYAGNVAGAIAMLFWPIALAAPAVMLAIGFAVRRREKQTLAIWNTLDRGVSVRVTDILENSDFSRDDVMRAVRLLNNRGLGFYVWHRESDVIEDGRLGDEYVHVEHCESCGAPVGLKIAVALREVPHCSYCQAPVTSGHLNILKRDAIQRLRGGTPAGRDYGVPVRPGRKALSIPLFIFLLMFCWPAAIFYAVYKAKNAYRH